MAATIGAKLDSTTAQFFGYVDLIQLAPTVSMTSVPIIPDPLSTDGCVPLDLAVSPITNQLVVRSSDPYFLSPNGSPAEVDVVCVSMTLGGGIVSQYAGNGYQMGTDSLAAPATGYLNTNKLILSITQEPPPPSPVGLDFTHLVD